MGLHCGGHTPSSRDRAATKRGELRHARVRHAGDTPPEGFAWRKTPTATSVERAAGAEARMGHRWVAETRQLHTRKVPRRNKSRPTRTTPCRFGTKLSQHAPSHRMCGTKLSLHARPRRISGIKLSLLTRNGSIWRFFDMQGEFCTVLTTKKPSRESFVPNARQRWGSPTQQDTRPHLCGGRRRDRRVREDSRRRAKSHINDLAPLVWRTSESPEGPAAAPVDNGARPQYPQTTATPRPDKFRMQFPHDTD